MEHLPVRYGKKIIGRKGKIVNRGFFEATVA